MIHNQEPPNWVVERAKCNLELIFDALCQVLERDVDAMNAVPERQRLGRQFQLEVNADGTRPIALVTQVHSTDSLVKQKAYARFESRKTAISIQASSLSQLALALVRWDERARACKLYVGDDRYEVWELSQWVLGPIFFPN